MQPDKNRDNFDDDLVVSITVKGINELNKECYKWPQNTKHRVLRSGKHYGQNICSVTRSPITQIAYETPKKRKFIGASGTEPEQEVFNSGYNSSRGMTPIQKIFQREVKNLKTLSISRSLVSHDMDAGDELIIREFTTCLKTSTD